MVITLLTIKPVVVAKHINSPDWSFVSQPGIERVSSILRNAEEFLIEAGDASKTFPTITLWMDLLGFRSHLDEKNWNIKDTDVQLGLKRITVFHEVALQSMNDRYEIVHVNDAIVISQDLRQGEEAAIITDFLALVDLCFEISVLADREIGGFGVRGVVARGMRYGLRGNLGWTKEGSANIREPAFFCPRPIMMNTAFGRAYGVESSHELVKVSSLYVETPLITDYGASIMETWTWDEPIQIKNFGQYNLVRCEDHA